MPYYMTNSFNGSSPLIEEDEFWDPAWGKKTAVRTRKMHFGQFVDGKYLGKSGFLKQPCKSIPSLFSSQFWYCAHVIKDAIEKIEPGRHRFNTFNLRDSRESKTITHLYIINILDQIDAVDVDRSENLRYNSQDDDKTTFTISPLKLSKGRSDIALNHDLIEGRHLWVGPGAYGPGNAFVSDELHDVIQQYNTTPSPIDFYKTR